ncbi:MobF family relaxase [Streptomyces sp. NPDC058674]|uniref:MobF family relaxase n=1 Tax=Streptomyces sp. NPDC058674 TaxID=3346592 RepID=UPI00364FAD38
MTADIRVIKAGQMYRYYLRQTVVGDGRRPARTPMHEAQEQAGVPAGRWMGRGLAVLGLAPGEEVTESQLRNLFGERGRHPYADRIEADRLVAGASPKKAFKAGALGRRVMVTGVDFVFRPQPTIYLLWALGGEETRLVIEAAHERAIARVLEWIEDEVAVIRYGKDGICRVRPPGGVVAARFRHYEARSGMPLLHDHLLLSVKGQRLDGKWGSCRFRGLHPRDVSPLVNEYGLPRHNHCPGGKVDPEWLRTQYIELNRTITDIANDAEVSFTVVMRWLRTHKLTRPAGPKGNRRFSFPADDFGDADPLLQPVLSNNYHLRRLRIFLRVASYPMFATACDEHGLSRTAVNNSFKKLEADLGGRLVERASKGRSMQLTEFGQSVARAVLPLADRLGVRPEESERLRHIL